MAVLGLEFSSKSIAELAGEMLTSSIPQGQPPRFVFTANVDHVVQLRRKPEFRAAYHSAWVRTIDGFPVHMVAKIGGYRTIPRITGADLFTALIEGFNPQVHRCFFVVSSTAVANGIIQHLLDQGFQRESLQACVPAHGFEADANFSNALASRIRSHGTTHLFFGLGAPKSEIWCHKHAEMLGSCYVLCVGAGLEFYLGLKRRAPHLWRRSGFEWLWRFMQEPRRLFHRYFIDSWGFILAIVDDYRNGRTASRASDIESPPLA